MATNTPVPRTGKRWGHWLLEGLFIVISVLLAFAVDDFRESRENRRLAARVLQGLQAEIEQNIVALEPYIALHGQWIQALEKSANQSQGQSGLDVFLSTWPDSGTPNPKPPFAVLSRGAWDAALSTGALRLIDYELAAGLSEIYQFQEALDGSTEALLPLGLTSFYDPASRVPSVRQLWFAIAGTKSSEDILLALYRRHLPAIRAAALEF